MFFSKKNSSTNTQNNGINSPDYFGSKTLTAILDKGFAQKFSMAINNLIVDNTSIDTRGLMSDSMKADLYRMHYYIDNYRVSTPGDFESSYQNFIDHGGEQWTHDYVDSISAFLHQGIFVDIFESIPYWEDSNGYRFDISMASLNSTNCSNAFHINKSGIIEIKSQSYVNNIICKRKGFVATNRVTSVFSLHISLIIMKVIGSHCLVMAADNLADRATLQLDFNV
ncbi:hypothetical protein [Yersinia sp. Marseille-Q3913]|uniref:hypothetical protein n=1 Tax=Yersinia sp. Marseille-Q3913 TaxID=2830769 RepID=UPI001BAF0442|nr:hypothetical protein [Yersinia sp. Marseille-Q3913]MBS0055833.1 hypothetical protein [Yersinia sp. Marseille-Q3913]